MPEKLSGRVKFFMANKGWGFITQDDESKKEIFVHQNKIIDKMLMRDDPVTYDIGIDAQTGREVAINVEGGTGPLEGWRTNANFQVEDGEGDDNAAGLKGKARNPKGGKKGGGKKGVFQQGQLPPHLRKGMRKGLGPEAGLPNVHHQMPLSMDPSFVPSPGIAGLHSPAPSNVQLFMDTTKGSFVPVSPLVYQGSPFPSPTFGAENQVLMPNGMMYDPMGLMAATTSPYTEAATTPIPLMYQYTGHNPGVMDNMANAAGGAFVPYPTAVLNPYYGPVSV